MIAHVSSVGGHGIKICLNDNKSATENHASHADQVLGVTKELWFGNVGSLKDLQTMARKRSETTDSRITCFNVGITQEDIRYEELKQKYPTLLLAIEIARMTKK